MAKLNHESFNSSTEDLMSLINKGLKEHDFDNNEPDEVAISDNKQKRVNIVQKAESLII
jgi:hypothetical protein